MSAGELDPVATVCGSEVRLYGPVEANGRRPLRGIVPCRHHGDALDVAATYEERRPPAAAPQGGAS